MQKLRSLDELPEWATILVDGDSVFVGHEDRRPKHGYSGDGIPTTNR